MRSDIFIGADHVSVEFPCRCIRWHEDYSQICGMGTAFGTWNFWYHREAFRTGDHRMRKTSAHRIALGFIADPAPAQSAKSCRHEAQAARERFRPSRRNGRCLDRVNNPLAWVVFSKDTPPCSESQSSWAASPRGPCGGATFAPLV